MRADTPCPLTVVVPAFNEEALLAGTVRGLREALTALGLAAEIVIVNDGSRDRTGAIADELAGQDAALTVCHQANQGLGNAAIFNGLYGADRNANGLLDRGPVPTSVRLRAVQVGRFNYYDLRVPATIR